jgi:hypothetical protein
MQIHEIFRRRTNEGILKGVANNVVKPVAKYVGNQAKGIALAPLNTAEYFANKVLNAAGVPQDQQGNYSKYGQIAAGQRQGVDAIQQQEHQIGDRLAREWASTGSLNGVNSPNLDLQDIEQAANALNQAGSRLDININNIAQTVQTLAPQYVKDREAQQQSRIDYQLNIKTLMGEIDKEYARSKDPALSAADRQQAIDAKNKVIATLKKLGQPVDQKYLDDTVTAAQNAVVQSAGAQALAPAAAAKAPATTATAKAPVASVQAAAPATKAPAASPAGFNYNNMMKMPGMSQPVKPAVKQPEPAMAESLTWSKDFDPSEQLYRRMKQGQAQ